MGTVMTVSVVTWAMWEVVVSLKTGWVRLSFVHTLSTSCVPVIDLQLSILCDTPDTVPTHSRPPLSPGPRPRPPPLALLALLLGSTIPACYKAPRSRAGLPSGAPAQHSCSLPDATPRLDPS